MTRTSFPTVFFLLSLPVSVGLITTNYNQHPLSSLLKSKRDTPCGFLWMIKPHGLRQAQIANASIASSKVSLGGNGREVPPSDWGRGRPWTRPVSSQLGVPTHPWEERSRWGNVEEVDKLAGWMFSGSLISRQLPSLWELGYDDTIIEVPAVPVECSQNENRNPRFVSPVEPT